MTRQILVNSSNQLFVFMYPFQSPVFDLSRVFRRIVLFFCIVVLGLLFGNFYTSLAAQYCMIAKEVNAQFLSAPSSFTTVQTEDTRLLYLELSTGRHC